MGEATGIQWTDHTFNPWIGCAKVSAGCRNCYAESWDLRFAGAGGVTHWGRSAPRRRTSTEYWRKPLLWNRAAAEAGRRARVFCASLADVFEDHACDATARDLRDWRAELWPLLEATPWLDWQLLTKRPENVLGMVPDRWLAQPWRGHGAPAGSWPLNVWIGTTIEGRDAYAARMPTMARIRDRIGWSPILFVSYEPALERIDWHAPIVGHRERPATAIIDWLIVGGESGPGARPFDVAIIDESLEATDGEGVSVFVKQLGTRPMCDGEPLNFNGKGGDVSTWPEAWRVREFPRLVMGVGR